MFTLNIDRTVRKYHITYPELKNLFFFSFFSGKTAAKTQRQSCIIIVDDICFILVFLRWTFGA